MARRLSGLLAISLLSTFQYGCDSQPQEPEHEYSDLEQWQVRVAIADVIPNHARPIQVLVGSRIFLPLVGVRADAGGYLEIPAELDECVHRLGHGILEWVEDDEEWSPHGLVVAPGPGAIVISAPREACPDYVGIGQDFVRDQWSLVGVDPADTSGNWVGDWERWAVAYGTSGPTAWPSSLRELQGGAVVQVAEGGTFYLDFALTRSVDGEAVEVLVSWKDGELVLPESWRGQNWSLEVGEQAAAHLDFDGVELTMPTLEGVPVDRIASLELVAVYDRDDSGERDWGLPTDVIALTHDAEGRRILGAPVEWSVSRGLLALESFPEASDVIGVSDSCRNLPVGEKDRREATIEARVAGLVASVDLEWTALRSDHVEIDTESPLCQGSACDCSASATPIDSLLATFGLLLLGVGVRRARPHLGQ